MIYPIMYTLIGLLTSFSIAVYLLYKNPRQDKQNPDFVMPLVLSFTFWPFIAPVLLLYYFIKGLVTLAEVVATRIRKARK